jgi:hypothetical protein
MTNNSSQGLDILAVWNDVDPEHEAEYHRWYWTQHLPERLSIPGFLSAYRYHAVDAAQKFFTWYFVRGIEVLRSPAYLDRLAHPTDWTQRVMPWFRNMTRCACRLRSDRGRGIGSVNVVLRVTDSTRAGSRPLLTAIDQLYASGDESIITRAQVWETDRQISNQRTPEQALRGGADQMVDAALVLHCASVESARKIAGQLRELSLTNAGAVCEGPYIYAFLHSLSVVG